MLVLPLQLGTLTLHRKLGTGSVAESYLATQADGSRAVARRILPFIAKDPHRLAAISARAEELAGFRHPSLVHVVGTFQEGGDTFMLEEHVEAVSLERLMAHARSHGQHLPPNVYLHIAVQVCNALEALHSRPSTSGADSVLHLGIKPGAIFVGPEGKVVVGSFGLSRSPTTLPQGGVSAPVAARMEYLSPEQTHPDQQITPASDLFSLGAVLYELLTLESLFRADSNLQTIHRIRRGEVTTQLLKVKSRMPGLDKVLYRALSVNPKQRYQRAFVLRDDLRGLMSGYSFASIVDDTKSWLKPIFDEAAPPMEAPAAERNTPEQPPVRPSTAATVTRSLVGLDDEGGGESETTDIGFFPPGRVEPPVRNLSPKAFPDPTASSLSAGSAPSASSPPPPALSPPPAAPPARPPSRSLVMLGDDDDNDAAAPPVRSGNTLLPESYTPESTAAWIPRNEADAEENTASHIPGSLGELSENTAAYIGHREPAPELTASGVGPDNTAAYIPARDDTAAHIGHVEPTASDASPARGDNTAAYLPIDVPEVNEEEVERTLTSPGPRSSIAPAAAAQPTAPEPPAPTPSPAPLLSSRPMPGPGISRTMPPPRSAPPPPPIDDDDSPPPPSRAPVLGMAIAGGLVAMLLCSGVIYGGYPYAVGARAERVAQALKDAQPPQIQVTDDPAGTMAGELTPVVDPLLAAAEPPREAPAAAALAPAPSTPPEPVATLPPVGAVPVARPVAAPVVAPVAVAQPVSKPVAVAPAEPVSKPVAVARAPEPAPVRSQPVSAPRTTTTPSRPVAVTPIVVAPDPTLDASLSIVPVESALNLDALATDARTGKLRSDDVDALMAVSISDPSYTRSQALLLSNAQRKGDAAGTERALKALFALPENTYNPQFLAADALYQVNRGQYDKALSRAQTAERYWSRLPPSQSFATRAQIYEVEAAAWQGKFYNSDGDMAALESAIRGWEKYRAHVATAARTDLQKNADTQIAKLQDIKERVSE